MNLPTRVFRSRAWLVALTLALPCAGAIAQGASSYIANFEPAEGHAPGPFDGYPEWTRIGGLSATVVTPGFDGTQRLELLGTGSLEWVSATAFGPGPVWLDLMLRPSAAAAGALPAAAPGRSALTGFVQVGATGEVYVFDGYGLATGAGVWRGTGVSLARAADGSFIPLRLTYRIDYSTRRWDLFVDEKLVWAGLGFADGALSGLSRFSLRADSSVSTGFDFFYVGQANPLFADTAGDGIPTAWWFAHGLDPATAGGRHGDADSDGLSNLAEYLLGLDPADDDSNHDGLPDGISAFGANFRPVVITAATLAATPGDGLAWRASFSAAEGYAPGALDGQQGWRGLRAEVTPGAEAHFGSAAGPAEIEQKFQTAALGGVWITFRARLQAGPLPEIQPALQPFAALFGFAGQRALVVRDGDAWVPYFVPVSAGDWNTYVLHLDYASGRWLLGLNGELVARDLAFNDPTRQTFSAFRALQAGVDGQAWLDDLVITEREPAGLDFDHDGLDGREEAVRDTDAFVPDTDGDGMPDGWEIAHGFNPLQASDGALDPDQDGLTNAFEAALGTDPAQRDDGVQGFAVMELWTGVAGNLVANLTDNSRYPQAPSSRKLLTKLEAGPNQGDSIGARVRGYIVAPADGEYRFWVSGDDRIELWLSPDTSPFGRQLVAFTEGYSDWEEFDKYEGQQSPAITLAAGQRYYFEVLYKEHAYGDHFSVAWTRPGSTAREIVSGPALATFAPRSDDLDGDGLADAWEIEQGLDPARGYGVQGAYGDYDGDGFSNKEEFDRGLKPLSYDTDGDTFGDRDELALGFNPQDPLSTPVDGLPSPWQIAQFGQKGLLRTAYFGDQLYIWSDSPSFTKTTDEGGLVYQAVTGNFIVSGDIYISSYTPYSSEGALMIRASLASDSPFVCVTRGIARDWTIRYRLVPGGPVSAAGWEAPDGVTKVELRRVNGTVEVYGAAPSGVIREVARFTLQFASDTACAGYTVWDRDSLSQASVINFKLGALTAVADAMPGLPADPNLVDFDSIKWMGEWDGLGDPASQAASFPNSARLEELAATGVAYENTVSLTGAQAQGLTGTWLTQGASLVSDGRRGEFGWNASLTGASIYLLELRIAEGISEKTSQSVFPLKLYIDEQYVGTRVVDVAAGTEQSALWFTPWLPEGAHSVRLLWDGAAGGTRLKVNALKLHRVGGSDMDGNAIPDWMDSRLETYNGVEFSPRRELLDVAQNYVWHPVHLLHKNDRQLKNQVVKTSVSPLPLEGRARWPELSQLRVANQPIPLEAGAGYRWYASVPLVPEQDREIRFEAENGVLVREFTARWVPYNALAGGELNLAAGSSLLLEVPLPGNSQNWTRQLLLDGQPVALSAAGIATVPFNAPGTYLLKATKTKKNGAPTEVTVTVHVHGSPAGEGPWPALVLRERTQNTILPDAPARLEADPRVGLVKLADSYAWQPDDNTDYRFVVRTGQDGPILKAVDAPASQIYMAQDTYMTILETLPDGTRLVESMIILSPKRPGHSVKLEIIVGGVLFDDGTRVKTLAEEDFDELGQAKIFFLWPPNAKSATCHKASLWYLDHKVAGK